MALHSAIDLLLVTADPKLLEAIRGGLASVNEGYLCRHVSSGEALYDTLRRDPPDLIVLHESGIPGVASKEIFEQARKLAAQSPVIVLGLRGRPNGLTLLWEGASDYLSLTEIERLPLIIERMLRERQSRIEQARLRNEFQRFADLWRENQRLVTVGRLAGSIAHEINNPLESVTNLLFLIEHESGLSAAAKAYLTMAQRELERVVQISTQTLNFCREAPAPVPLRLGELLDQVLVLYTHRISQKQLYVVRQIDDQEPVVAFPGEMRQVFSNLIVNAIEASSDGGKLILRIRKSRLWGDSGVLGQRVTIADNGSGMPQEVRRRVGEAFFTTKGQSGTGLGLWVAQSIIRRYGGNLFLHSSTGKYHGTVFSCFLPTNLRPQAVSEPTGPLASPTSPTAELGVASGKSLRNRQSRSRAKGA